jgi:4-aminobutyrate aminotransferase/(S)-3-amino-2-methylpropionate transaminase
MTVTSNTSPASATPVGGPVLPQVRRLVTEVPGPRSRALSNRRTNAVARGISSTLPVFIAAAGGGVLVDVDGNSFIDLGSGIAVVSVGNAAEHVVSGVTAQVAAFTHTCFMVTPYEGYVAVCEKLNALTPGDHPKKSALFNSGAEAVENAVKIARAHTGRPAVIVFDHAYHGRTNLTMALTAKNMPYKNSFGPFAPEVYRMPMSYPFRWPTGRANAGTEAAAIAISDMTTQVGVDNIAAVLIEPIQGEGGFIVPGAGFLSAIADFCWANGIVFIADEIQTGFARTGEMFASTAVRSHRPRRDHGRRPRRRPRWHIRRKPGRVRGGSRRDPHDRGARSGPAGASHRVADAAVPAHHGLEVPLDR